MLIINAIGYHIPPFRLHGHKSTALLHDTQPGQTSDSNVKELKFLAFAR
jgi:hypothetical protein